MANEYSNERMADMLEISTAAIQELKAKLNFRKRVPLGKEEYLIMKKIVDNIKKRFNKVTLSTINEYLKLKGIEEDEI